MKARKLELGYFSFLGKNEISKSSPKREFIDVIADAVKNPRDVNDCVAVPRGIFKAYMFIMAGSTCLTIAGLMPKKWTRISKGFALIGTGLNLISAFYFAKPFAFKGVSPTVNRETVEPVKVITDA